jgi:hypothetical protein
MDAAEKTKDLSLLPCVLPISIGAVEKAEQRGPGVATTKALQRACRASLVEKAE